MGLNLNFSAKAQLYGGMLEMSILSRKYHLFGVLCVCAGALAGPETCHAQVVNLSAYFVDAGFETPDLGGTPNVETGTLNAFDPNGVNFSFGWTAFAQSGTSNNAGFVVDPGPGFFTGQAPNGRFPVGSAFAGKQYAAGNFNNGTSVIRFDSQPIGKLTSNGTVTLKVAVGSRLQFAKVPNYTIGLVSEGVALGTFTPSVGLASGGTQDLSYSLNMGTLPGSFVGKNVSVRVTASVNTSDFTQAIFDNVRINGPLGVPGIQVAEFKVNRNTGMVSIINQGTLGNTSILGYTIKSEAGTLDSLGWTSVAAKYDKSGNGSVDLNNNWTILSGKNTDLSEMELEGGNGGVLSSSTPINLGPAWLKTPFEDLKVDLLLTDGSIARAFVTYEGTDIPVGDLTGDGSINALDWTAFKNGQGSDFTGLSAAEAYLRGDLDGDLDHDLRDFAAFKSAFVAALGAEAFAKLESVPEPGSLSMGALVIMAALMGRSFRNRLTEKEILRMRRVSIVNANYNLLGSLFGLLVSGLLFCSTSQAIDIDLSVLGIDPSFEEPDQMGDISGEQYSINGYGATNLGLIENFSPGWTAYAVNGFSNNIGFVVDPPDSFYVGNPGERYPTGFADGKQNGGGNFNVLTTQLSYWTTSIGVLQPDTVLTVKMDVGRRAIGAGPVSYSLGLQLLDGTPWDISNPKDPRGTKLGTFATANPIEGHWETMTYVLDTSTLDPGLIGQEVSIRLDASGADFSQATFDYARLDLAGDFAPFTLGLKVDPTDGDVSLVNETAGDVTLDAYSIQSALRSLAPGGWGSISNASNFPVGSGVGDGWEKGSHPSAAELVEYYLLGESVLPVGSEIYLGKAYNYTLNAQDLKFTYSTGSGFIAGLVTYEPFVPAVDTADFDGDGDVDGKDFLIWQVGFGKSGASRSNGDANGDGVVNKLDLDIWKTQYGMVALVSAVAEANAVPEPNSLLLLGLGSLSFFYHLRPRSQTSRSIGGSSSSNKITVAVAIAVVTLFGSLAASSSALVTNDRVYHFGDDPLEHASPGLPVGSGTGNPTPGGTLDSLGPVSGTFQDLLATSATYRNVSVTSPSLLTTRPGATSGNLGIEFNGTSSYLRGSRLGYPSTTASSTGGSGSLDYSGLSNRGFQLWIYPDSAKSGSDQNVVIDTNQHGLRIGASGNWVMRYAGTDLDSGSPVIFNDWSHVMVSRSINGGVSGGSILYVNGVAVKASTAQYDATANLQLVIGSNTGDNIGTSVGSQDHFDGVLDELEMFVMGTTINGLNRGSFNFGTDNQYAALNLTGVAGDVDQNGVLDPVADVNAFIAGWGSENFVDGVRVGDMSTILNGDLNFDGITDLTDGFLLHHALLAELGIGLDFSRIGQPVPEPMTFSLLLFVGCWVLAKRSRPLERNC
jgi:hypothetical protein